MCLATSAYFLEKSLSGTVSFCFSTKETQNLHFIDFAESISRICKHGLRTFLGVNCCIEDRDGSRTSGKSKKKISFLFGPRFSSVLVSNERSTFAFHRVTMSLCQVPHPRIKVFDPSPRYHAINRNDTVLCSS